MTEVPYASMDLHEIANRNKEAANVLAGFSSGMPSLAEIWRFLETALADVPALSTELTRLASVLTDTRLDRANLLAAAQATLSAYTDGEADPLWYLRAELEVRRALPPESRGRT